MKLTLKSVFIVSFIVFLNCVCSGCGPKKAEDTRKTAYIEQESMTKVPAAEREIPTEGPEGPGGSDENLPRVTNYKLCAVDDGKISSVKQYDETMEKNAAMDEIYENMLTKLGMYLGYELKFHEVCVAEDCVKIDWDKSCDLFHKEKFDQNTDGAVRYSDYDDMVFGILDSVNQTVKENHGQSVQVYYTEDGKELNLPQLSVVTEFFTEEAYQGSEYYRNRYLTRAEGNLSLLVQLGMTYNEVLIKLDRNGIDSSQNESFSLLGNHSGWEQCATLDEYLKRCWIRIDLSDADYRYVFDGTIATLMEIDVKTKKIPSSRGLHIGDSFERMQELYGTEYVMYVSEDGLIYEYRLQDGYFRVLVDSAQEEVLSFGISSFSQADLVRGQQIREKILYKEQQEQAENSGTEE